jgi:membrane protease YdiL (CAAX protease family)
VFAETAAACALAVCCAVVSAVSVQVSVRIRRRWSSWPARCRRLSLRALPVWVPIAAAAAMAASQALLAAATQIGWLAPPSADMPMDVRSLVVRTLLPAAAGLAALWTAVRAGRLRLRLGLNASRARLGARQGIWAYLAALPAVALAALVWGAALRAAGLPVTTQPLVDLIAGGAARPAMVLYLAAVAVSLAPVVEEILFRGLILPALMRHYAPWQATLIVSTLFACIHLHAPSVGPLFVLAWALAFAYQWTGSLAAPIVMHALFNAVNLAVMLNM